MPKTCWVLICFFVILGFFLGAWDRTHDFALARRHLHCWAVSPILVHFFLSVIKLQMIMMKAAVLLASWSLCLLHWWTDTAPSSLHFVHNVLLDFLAAGSFFNLKLQLFTVIPLLTTTPTPKSSDLIRNGSTHLYCQHSGRLSHKNTNSSSVWVMWWLSKTLSQI